MLNNIDEVISKMLLVDNSNLKDNIPKLLELIKSALDINKDLLLETNKVDVNNDNGFEINTDVFDDIFNNIISETRLFGNVTLTQKDEEIIYGKQIMEIGNVVIINDGNPYVTLEMSLRNIMAGNKTLLVNDGYMLGTNEFIINMIQAVLEENNVSNLIQLYKTNEIEEVLNNFANIDLVICIGNQILQQEVLKKSKNKTITSGYENFELYIEDLSHVEFIDKIISLGLNVEVYVQEGLEYDGISVSDIDEAIGQINYNGGRYSTSIFTNSSENASKFIREIKSKIVTVNTSPTIERLIDINQSDLTNEKIIIYPNNYKFDGKTDSIDLNE